MLAPVPHVGIYERKSPGYCIDHLSNQSCVGRTWANHNLALFNFFGGFCLLLMRQQGVPIGHSSHVWILEKNNNSLANDESNSHVRPGMQHGRDIIGGHLRKEACEVFHILHFQANDVVRFSCLRQISLCLLEA
jgi:hypothetical protein